MRRPRFRDLSLARKLLLPYLALMLIVGVAGTFTVVRSLSERAEATLHQQLGRDLLDARATVRDQELYALEAANFAANLRDIPQRVRARDTEATRRLLSSVLALKTDVDLLVATDTAGTGVAEYLRDRGTLREGLGTRWANEPFLRDALRSTSGGATAGILRLGERSYLAVATPMCSGEGRCTPVGVAVAGMSMARVAATAAGRRGEVALYDRNGAALGTSGAAAVLPQDRRTAAGDLVVVRSDRGGRPVATMVAPLEIQRQPVGFLTATRPADTSFASVRGAAYRLAVLVLLAMLGIVAIGALLSRTILRQVRPLVATHRALGAGDLSARTPVAGDDELGEVARGLNRMAEQLEASVTALESQVAQRTSEVRRLLAQRTELFAGLSHEFRTPLAIVLAQSQLMLQSGRRRPEGERESLLVVQQSARQALALVNEFLDLSRAEADRMEVAALPVDLAALVRDLGATIRGLAASAGVQVVLDVPDEPVVVQGDDRRLRDIVLNLSDNAIKYTPPGGSVRLSVSAHEDRVLLEVTDTGLGIPEEALGQLFEAFYRVADNQPQAGQPSSGLGLALTKRLVEAHGGSIDVTSEVGRGTTFLVRLPAMADVDVAGHAVLPGDLASVLNPPLPAR